MISTTTTPLKSFISGVVKFLSAGQIQTVDLQHKMIFTFFRGKQKKKQEHNWKKKKKEKVKEEEDRGKTEGGAYVKRSYPAKPKVFTVWFFICYPLT